MTLWRDSAHVGEEIRIIPLRKRKQVLFHNVPIFKVPHVYRTAPKTQTRSVCARGATERVNQSGAFKAARTFPPAPGKRPSRDTATSEVSHGASLNISRAGARPTSQVCCVGPGLTAWRRWGPVPTRSEGHASQAQPAPRRGADTRPKF